MKIHFAASAKDIKNDIEVFRLIRKAIIDNGNVLIRDWIDEAYDRTRKGKVFSGKAWKTIYQETSRAILEADAVIMEASNPAFAVGYQIALAIQHKKPTLVLTGENRPGLGAFGASIDSDLIRYRSYSQETVADAIQNFIQDSTFKGKQKRFNFFVDQRIYNYLKGAAFAQGKTKAEVLRGLVEKQISLEQETATE